MALNDRTRIPEHPPIPPQMARKGPRRRMLMTPQMIAIGGMLAFFTVVFSVVVLPTQTYKPPPSDDWLPLSDAAFRGRAVYLSNGCVYCHSGFSRPQDTFSGRYYLYTRVSDPGDFYGLNQSPNVMGSERTGPDLSQEGGHHPDAWHVAHYMNPRHTQPLSIMPAFSFLSERRMKELIAFNQSQGGKEATLRYAAIRVGNMLMASNMGMMGGMMDMAKPSPALMDLIDRLQASGEYVDAGQPMDKSESGLPWKAVWHMNSMERSYWVTQNPLQLTQQNLMRGKAIFIRRCSGCHGAQGDGKGPAAEFLHIKPFDFTDGEEMSGPGSSDGMLYHRILTGGPGTAMENFGTRLSVEDTWRVVLFLRTIENGGLKQTLPSTDQYKVWSPPPPMQRYIDTHPITATSQDASFRGKDPFMQAARWVAPGMAEADTILIGGKLPMTLERLAGLIRSTYEAMVRQAYDEAKARGEPLPPRDRIESTEGLAFHAP